MAAVFFSMSVVCAGRSTRLVGASAANFLRMAIGWGVLAVWAHGMGGGLRGAGLVYFLASGLIGLGVGDVALFQTLPRLGSRLTILVVQCFAAPLGALVEWAWLGGGLNGLQMVGGGIILSGVAVALWPGATVPGSQMASGVAWGLLAALGQGAGAVVSRRASELDQMQGFVIDGGTAAYQRLLGGIVISATAFAISHFLRRRGDEPERHWKGAWPWIAANGLLGLVLGVACYQWALRETATGIVLSIVATTPLLTIPLAWLLEGDRPGWPALAGGIMAVAGIIILRLA